MDQKTSVVKLTYKVIILVTIGYFLLSQKTSYAQSVEDYQSPTKPGVGKRFASYFNRGDFDVTLSGEYVFLISPYESPKDHTVDSPLGFSGAITFGPIGIGGTFLRIDLTDKIDNNVVLQNTFAMFDIYGRLPLPPFIDILIGAGIGVGTLECKNAFCSNLYQNIQLDKQGLASLQGFIKLAIWAGKIYRISLSYRHVISNLKSVKNPNTNVDQKLPSALYGLGAGVIIVF